MVDVPTFCSVFGRSSFFARLRLWLLLGLRDALVGDLEEPVLRVFGELLEECRFAPGAGDLRDRDLPDYSAY